MIRVVLPYGLRVLAGTGAEIELNVPAPATLRRLIDEMEHRHPGLRGAIRDYATGARRPYLRFFALNEDLSFQPLDALLPEPVQRGEEPLLIIGAVSGGKKRQKTGKKRDSQHFPNFRQRRGLQ